MSKIISKVLSKKAWKWYCLTSWTKHKLHGKELFNNVLATNNKGYKKKEEDMNNIQNRLWGSVWFT